MLNLGQKTLLRKAIRPFGEEYRALKSIYDRLSEPERKRQMLSLDKKEDAMMEVFNSIKPSMSEEDILEWTEFIKSECNKVERSFDFARDDDFQDGFRPQKKPDGATAYDERPVFPVEQKPAHPEAMGCFGQQIQRSFSTNQQVLDLGE